MEVKLPTKNALTDTGNKYLETKVNEGVEFIVYSDTHDLLVYAHNQEQMTGETIFGLWVAFGKDKEKTIMCDVEINELELFANSILKQIEIMRNNYSEQIKYQTDKGIHI